MEYPSAFLLFNPLCGHLYTIIGHFMTQAYSRDIRSKWCEKTTKKNHTYKYQTLNENKTTEMRIKRHAMFQLRQTQSVCSQLNGCFCMALNEQALQHWHEHTHKHRWIEITEHSKEYTSCRFLHIEDTQSFAPSLNAYNKMDTMIPAAFFAFCGKNEIVITISFISNWSFKSMEFKFRFTKCISLLVILLHSMKSAYSLHFRLHEPTKAHL